MREKEGQGWEHGKQREVRERGGKAGGNRIMKGVQYVREGKGMGVSK